MTEQDKKIANLELEISFYKNEIQKANKVNMDLTEQLRIGGVSNRRELLFCGHCESESEHKKFDNGDLQCLNCNGIAKL